MHKSVMVITAICSVVSFLAGGVRDRHLRRPRWSPGLLWPTAPGTTAPPQNPSAQSPKSLPTQRRKLMMPADLKRLHKYTLDVEHIGIISDEMREVVEELWPELTHKLPPKGSRHTIPARAQRLRKAHIVGNTGSPPPRF